jgi:hypothetical protein
MEDALPEEKDQGKALNQNDTSVDEMIFEEKDKNLFKN